ncbi:hypothetical protein WICPIJ_008498 [Wickerhamomyces pijperi]|uniref:Uncharacterized protein n=1 Tax=Wickerhamomyces pijperi TaxID=599730 RepID=A0A9P8PWU3_WICPI|nr:hypothetical protein WICPIJ_008498 [Wickerhamomyces pijperi]
MFNIKRFQCLPLEVLTQIINYLPSFQRQFIYQQFHNLRNVRIKQNVVITFLKEDQDSVLSDDLLQINDDRERFFVTIPKSINFKGPVIVNSQDSKEIFNQLNKLLPLLSHQMNNHEHVVLEFAFDLSSDSCYEAMNFYTTIAPFFSNVSHFVQILKSERPLYEITKSKFHDLRLFDRIIRGYSSLDLEHLDRLTLRFPTPRFQTHYDKDYQINSTFFFNDIPLGDKMELIRRSSSLVSISLILPNTKYRLDKEQPMITSLRAATISSIRKNIDDHFYEMGFQDYNCNIFLNRYPSSFETDRSLVSPTLQVCPIESTTLEKQRILFPSEMNRLAQHRMDMTNKVFCHYNSSTAENISMGVEGEEEVEEEDVLYTPLQDHIALTESSINTSMFEMFLPFERD